MRLNKSWNTYITTYIVCSVLSWLHILIVLTHITYSQLNVMTCMYTALCNHLCTGWRHQSQSYKPDTHALVFSCPGSSRPDLGQWLSDWVPLLNFDTKSDFWHLTPFTHLIGVMSGQKDRRTKRQKENKKEKKEKKKRKTIKR